MKKTALLVAVSVLFVGCSSNGKLKGLRTSNSCGGTGYTFTPIWYGDSTLKAFALSDIGRDSEWRFRLLPGKQSAGIDYRTALVTVTAKNAATFPWLNVSGQQSVDPVLVLCVPSAVPVGTQIEYMINVQFVGDLDPRADVIQ